MIIGIDIDDTITKTSEATDICAKKYFEEVLKKPFEILKYDVTSPYWMQEKYGWDDEVFDNFIENYFSHIMLDIEIKENASETINKLYEDNEIVLITARYDTDEVNMTDITKLYLQQNGIKYNKLFVGHEDKRNIAQANNIELFIDDNYKTCKQISELGIKTWMMNSMLNKNLEPENFERVYSWKEIEHKFNEL